MNLNEIKYTNNMQPRTNLDKRQLVITILKYYPRHNDGKLKSHREIARYCKVSPTFVSKISNELKQNIQKNQLYFIRCGNTVKIGISDNPIIRLKQLQVSNPQKLELLATIPNAASKEKLYHKKLERFHISGEWFQYSDEIRKLIAELL